jgi:hypothetical protein
LGEIEGGESWGGVVRATTVLEWGGVIQTEFGSSEGSQAVPAIPSGKGEACIRDLFNYDFKDVGAAVIIIITSLHPSIDLYVGNIPYDPRL